MYVCSETGTLQYKVIHQEFVLVLLLVKTNFQVPKAKAGESIFASQWAGLL